jgi:hypothetical protein
LGCSQPDIRMNLSDLMIERRIELESADLLILSFEALDSLFSNESISVESEDSFLRLIFQTWFKLSRFAEAYSRETPLIFERCPSTEIGQYRGRFFIFLEKTSGFKQSLEILIWNCHWALYGAHPCRFRSKRVSENISVTFQDSSLLCREIMNRSH